MTDLRLSSVTLGTFFRDIVQPFLDAACTPLEAAGPGEIVGIELEIQYLRGGTLVVHAPERFLFQAENRRVRPTEWSLLGSAARSHVAVPALDLVHEVQRAARDLLPVIDHMSRQAEEDETFRLGLLHGGGYIAAMEIDPSVLGPDGPDAIDGRLAQALLDQGLQLVLPLHDSAHAAMAAIETMSRVHDIALDLHPVPIPGGEILEMVFHLPRRA